MAIKLSLHDLFSHPTYWQETSDRFLQGGWHLSFDHGIIDSDDLKFEVYVPGENAKAFEELFSPEQISLLMDYGLYLKEIDITLKRRFC